MKQAKQAAGILLADKYPGVVYDVQDLRFLMIRVANCENDWCYGANGEYGEWDLPKGVIESGENPMSAAIRETAEETGLTSDVDFKIIRRVCLQHKSLHLFLGVNLDGEVTLEENPETGELEHVEYAWMTPEEMKEMCMPSLVDPISDMVKLIEREYIDV